MSLPIIVVRWIEWIHKKQPQILRLRLRMTRVGIAERVADRGCWRIVACSTVAMQLSHRKEDGVRGLTRDSALTSQRSRQRECSGFEVEFAFNVSPWLKPVLILLVFCGGENPCLPQD